MTQQARSLLDLGVTAQGAITYGRAVLVGAAADGINMVGIQASATAQKITGIARRSAVDGEGVEITCCGTAVCETGAGAILPGDRVQCDAQGRAVKATVAGVAAGGVAVTSTAANGAILTGADLPGYSWGMALQGSAGQGNYIEVLITH